MSPRAASHHRPSARSSGVPRVSATMQPSASAGSRNRYHGGAKVYPDVLHRPVAWPRGPSRGRRSSGVELRGIPRGTVQRPSEVYAMRPPRRSSTERHSLSSVNEAYDPLDTARPSGSYARDRRVPQVGHMAWGSVPRGSIEADSMEYCSGTGPWAAEEASFQAHRSPSSSFETARSSTSLELVGSPHKYQCSYLSPVSASVNIMVYGGNGKPSRRKPRVISHSFAKLSEPQKAGHTVNDMGRMSAGLHSDNGKLRRTNKVEVPCLSETVEPKIAPSIGGLNLNDAPRACWRMQRY